MALYTTSSPSVNNTLTINDSLTANNHHHQHLQPDKRSVMDNDNAIPAKRKRLSMTITEPNVTMNATMSPTLENETTTTLSATNGHNIPFSQLQDTIVISTETSQRTTPTQQLDEALSQQDPTVSKSSISSQLPPTLHQQDPLGNTESAQQEQETESSLPSRLPSISHQSPSIPQQQQHQDTVGSTDTLQPFGTQQKHEIAVSLSPLSPTIPSRSPPTSPIYQQLQESPETVEAPPLPQPDLETQQLYEPTATLIPSPSTRPSPIQSTSEEEVAISPPKEAATTSNVVASTVASLPPTIKSAPPAPVEAEGRSKRKRKPVDYNAGIWETFNKISPGKRKRGVTPRWYTQSYMIFLALREHPDHCLSRPDLINAALAMDEKISKERNLPRVFRSKTPTNSASAVLTLNVDRYYIPYKPEGSRSTWFRLAYTPGNFDHAYGEYRGWMDKLIKHDWLYCFGEPLENSTPMTMDEIAVITPFSSTALPTTDTDQPADVNNNNVAVDTSAAPVNNTDNNNNSNHTVESSSPVKDNNNDSNSSLTIESSPPMEVTNNGSSSTAQTFSPPPPPSSSSSSSSSPSSSSNVTKLDQVNSEHPPQPMYRLNQLDVSNVPTKWQDIVRVDTSTIPNAGHGLFAVRELPYNTPLGFYFGVPMTEYEFDSIKENVGRASEYSIMYRKTILDATDEHGEPYTICDENNNQEQRLCPFHYMNEAKDVNMANILFVEGVVVNQVICWSKRNILPGEELLVWYGKEVNRYWKDDSDQ